MVWPKKKGLCIRLIRMGCANRPFYQIGALPSTRRPHLLPDEVIGCIDPVPNEKNEIIASVDLKRLAYWMGRGAQLSNGTQRVLGLSSSLIFNLILMTFVFKSYLKSNDILFVFMSYLKSNDMLFVNEKRFGRLDTNSSSDLYPGFE
jgi:ribosomal protein S16